MMSTPTSLKNRRVIRRRADFRLLRVFRAARIYCVALGSLVALPAAADGAARVLQYRVAWNGIPAAHAKVEITPRQVAGGDGVVVEATASTNRVVDLFWSFRGTARTTVLAEGLKPLRFVYDRQMDGKPYLTWIDFGSDGARSVYVKGDRRREVQTSGPALLDPITAVYRACASGAKPGDRLRYDVWTGEARYRVDLAIEGPEPLDVPAGHFRALRVVPEIWKLGDKPELDTRVRQATIWVTDDPAHTLLRIRSEVFVGAVTLDLVSMDSAA
jgi:hypothetical protein